MNPYRGYCFFIFLSISVSSFAESTEDHGDYWECTADDATGAQWTSQSMYQKIALNLAYAKCKKNSQNPTTCRTSETSCAQFIQGVNVMPIWQCTALDAKGLTWNSTLYLNQESAALAALAYCKQKSPVPLTCYMNMATCINLNSAY